MKHKTTHYVCGNDLSYKSNEDTPPCNGEFFSFFPFILDIVKYLVLVSTNVSRHPQIFEKVSYPLHRKDLVEVSYPTFIVKTAISVMNYQLGKIINTI
jgi:hypothetical protein